MRTLAVGAVGVAFFAACIVHVLHGAMSAEDIDGGWGVDRVADLDTRRCTIPRIAAATLTRDEFERRYLERHPVILLMATNATEFRFRVRKAALLEAHGGDDIVVSSANRDSYEKRKTTLSSHVASIMKPLDASHSHANETWYFFGDNDREGWSDLFRFYQVPTRFVFGPHTTLSFGVAASGSGVPFHTHGHVFAEVLYGWKRWWLQDPQLPPPRGEGNVTTLTYVRNVYPALSTMELEQLHECVLGINEMLYIPSGWYHATLNIGPTVFMSTFV